MGRGPCGWNESVNDYSTINLKLARASGDGDSTFADPDHAAESKEEEEAETVDATLIAPPVEHMIVELVAATAPSKPTQPQTSFQKLEAAYGAALHHNDRTQLDGSIANNKLWQAYWRDIVALSPQRYNVLEGKVRRIFIDALNKELEGIEGRQLPSRDLAEDD